MVQDKRHPDATELCANEHKKLVNHGFIWLFPDGDDACILVVTDLVYQF
jgi:hypothetical protein